MYGKMIALTLLAWFMGLLLDANIGFEPVGFLCLRVVLPLIAVGLCLLFEIRRQSTKKDTSSSERENGTP